MNHRLDEIFNDSPVALPKTVTRLNNNNRNYLLPSPPSRQHDQQQSPPRLTDMQEAYEALDVVLAQIFNQDTQTCISALAQLDELMKDSEKVQLLESRMDQLLVSCSMQYRYVLHDKMRDESFDPVEVLKLFQFLTMALMSAYHHQVSSAGRRICLFFFSTR